MGPASRMSPPPDFCAEKEGPLLVGTWYCSRDILMVDIVGCEKSNGVDIGEIVS